jgi:hypothetical protein
MKILFHTSSFSVIPAPIIQRENERNFLHEGAEDDDVHQKFNIHFFEVFFRSYTFTFKFEFVRGLGRLAAATG